jgi:hypothetical protein
MDQSITRSRHARALAFVVALLGAAALLALHPGRAPAHTDTAQSGKSCNSAADLDIYNCVQVLGGGLHVDKVKGRTAMVYDTETMIYHFELWAGRWHHNTRDQVWEGTSALDPLAHYVDSGWVSVNRNFRDGTGVCSRLWVKRDGDWHSYDGMTCLKLTR